MLTCCTGEFWNLQTDFFAIIGSSHSRPTGQYRWRVRAIDAHNNTGKNSDYRVFHVK